MKIISETSLSNFEAWSGGRDTLMVLQNNLTTDQLNDLESFIENEVFEGEPVTDTQLNDFLWFESDTIASHFGYDDWESFEKSFEEEDEDDEEEEDDEDESSDEESDDLEG